MIARVSKALGTTLVVGNEYPVIEVKGSNVIIMLDGCEIGFSTSYLTVIDDQAEARKKLSDERNDIDRQIGLLKQRKAVVEARIDEIDALTINQTKMII
jgi:hypothetical protein